MTAASMPKMNREMTAQLSLSPAEERELLDGLREAERELAAALSDVGESVDEPPRRKPHRWRMKVDEFVESLDRADPSSSRILRLHQRVRRLVWRLAMSGLSQVDHVLSKQSFSRVSQEDMRQAGVVGLFRAARRFEPARGLRFSTYCRYWVQATVGDLVGEQEYVVRLPSKARRQLCKEPEALSDRQARALDRVRHSVALDQPTAADGSQTWGERLEDGRIEPPVEQVVHRQRLQAVREALDVAPLDARQRKILAHRFELGGADHKTFRELGEGLGISGERARQLQVKALRNLRETLSDSVTSRSAA